MESLVKNALQHLLSHKYVGIHVSIIKHTEFLNFKNLVLSSNWWTPLLIATSSQCSLGINVEVDNQKQQAYCLSSHFLDFAGVKFLMIVPVPVLHRCLSSILFVARLFSLFFPTALLSSFLII